MASRVQIVLALIVGIAIGAGGHALMSRPSQTDSSGRSKVSSASPEKSGTPASDGESAVAQPVPPPLPEIPISLNYVEAPNRNGYVVQFHNESQKHLAVLLELENKTLDERRSGPLRLAPGQMVEIGGTSDWTFVSGETATMKLDGYQTKTFQVP